MHEIITLQLGQAANYVGTHFWNTQEAYFTYGDEKESPVNHNVHFRAGIGAGGADTFTPRALVYDLKGGFGCMRKVNALYDEVETNRAGEAVMPKGLWDHKTTTQLESPIEQVQFQKDLDAGISPPTPLTPETVRYWSDFNRVYYHPRSSVQINEYTLDSKLQPFERYEGGKELFQQLHREHDLLDRDFRLFAEECDQMQGVNVITSADDGWAGFAGEYIQELRDEYGKVGIVTWGIEKGDRVPREKQLTRTVALAMALSSIASLSSLYVPLQNAPSVLPDYVRVNRQSQWHTTALLAAGIETSTLPTRLQGNGGRLGKLGDLAAFLNATGSQKIAMLSMRVGGGGQDKNAEDDYEGSPPSFKTALKAKQVNCSWGKEPEVRSQRSSRNRKDHTFVKANVVRGYQETAEPEETGYRGKDDRHESIFSREVSTLAFPVVDGFPNIFPLHGTPPATDGTPGKNCCAVDTELSTTTAIIGRIKQLKDVSAFYVAVDEREALLNDLDEIIDGFQEGWHSDSESGDD